MKFNNQVETLRMFAQLSGPSKKPVGAEDLAESLSMSAATTGLCSGFFRDSGWVTKTGRGVYSATDALLSYNRHLNVDPDDHAGALPSLVDSVRGSWYWEAVEPLLPGGARQSVLLHSLSKASGAFNHKAQLGVVLEWLEWLGLIRRDGEMLHAALATPVVVQSLSEAETHVEQRVDTTSDHDLEPVSDTASAAVGSPAASTTPVAQSLAVDDAVASLISFNLSVRITAEDAARLTPEQITSLLEVVDKLRG